MGGKVDKLALGYSIERQSRMLSSERFNKRLMDVRAAYAAASPESRAGGYVNGDVLVGSNDVSRWDNFDQYFKFYSIYPA